MAKSDASVLAHCDPVSPVDWGIAYRLDVIATSIDGIVASVGAWLFDRAKAGWRVRAFVSDCGDQTPLRILGVDEVEPLNALTAEHLSSSSALAVDGGALEANEMLTRRAYVPALQQEKEIIVWGRLPVRLREDCQLVQYARPSIAAELFKSHALAAAGRAAQARSKPETFHRTTRSMLHYQTDLLTVGDTTSPSTTIVDPIP